MCVAVLTITLFLFVPSVWGLRKDTISSFYAIEREENRIECAPSDLLRQHLNLTESELQIVSRQLCLPPTILELKRLEKRRITSRYGIPEGVRCIPTTWCDSGACTTVCKRGSVHIEDWLVRAHKLQNSLAASIPFCYSSWLGTHNSAITLADGYGNLDPMYQSMFDYIKWVIPEGSSSLLRTNDQWFSLTDQLNMGVRLLEIDTHWVEVRLWMPPSFVP